MVYDGFQSGLSLFIARAHTSAPCPAAGAKCNTQVVIPHMTENYGASRDPPEKSAPMCTVHSFPHNIDHCLTWARSEFEGILEKAPAEANSYLQDPEKYSASMRQAGDGQARDQLEKASPPPHNPSPSRLSKAKQKYHSKRSRGRIMFVY